MIVGIVTWILKWLSGGIVDKALEAFNKLNDTQIRAKEIDAETAKAAVNAYVESQRVQAQLESQKLSFPWYWLLGSLFILPLALWWSSIILDSVFHFGWRVADLPTPALREWAGQIITFLFYSGGTVVGIKAILGRK